MAVSVQITLIICVSIVLLNIITSMKGRGKDE